MVTIRDVAREAGVAASTVSNILNKRVDCWASEETKKRVIEAAERLNYRRSYAARLLRLGRSQSVGVIVPDLVNPCYITLVKALEIEFEKWGYVIIIEDTDSSVEGERKALEKMKSLQVDGIVAALISPESHQEFIESEVRSRRPLINFGTMYSNVSCDTIESDLLGGLKEAISHLQQLNHKEIGFVAGYVAEQANDVRVRLFSSSVRDAGMRFVPEFVRTCGPGLETAYGVAKELLSSRQGRPSAIVALNDVIAISVIRAALDLGIRVPSDLSVVGFDDMLFSNFLPIRLSTVAQPYETMSQKAVEFFLERIGTDDWTPPRYLRIETKLIARESTGLCPSLPST